MIVRHVLPMKWKCLLSILEDLPQVFPERVARRIFRVNRRLIAINAKRRPA